MKKTNRLLPSAWGYLSQAIWYALKENDRSWLFSIGANTDNAIKDLADGRQTTVYRCTEEELRDIFEQNLYQELMETCKFPDLLVRTSSGVYQQDFVQDRWIGFTDACKVFNIHL